jgi:hypothetical protein
VFFRSRRDTALEVLALRQQVAVLKRKRPRPKLNRLDRLFWSALRQCWSRWTEVLLVIVKPDTVIGWHRAGFRLYWRGSQNRNGARAKQKLRRRRAPQKPRSSAETTSRTGNATERITTLLVAAAGGTP